MFGDLSNKLFVLIWLDILEFLLSFSLWVGIYIVFCKFFFVFGVCFFGKIGKVVLRRGICSIVKVLEICKWYVELYISSMYFIRCRFNRIGVKVVF